MALSSAAARLAPRMDAELLVKTHWAFARLRARPSPGDTRLIVDAARRLVGDLEEDDRLTVMHAWGVLRINPGDDVVRAFTETFRSVEDAAAEGSAEGSSSDASPEASLDGADCAKLLCAYGRTRHQPPAAHAAALAKRLAEAAAEDELHPSAAVLGLWGASLLGLRMGTDQLDALARDAMNPLLTLVRRAAQEGGAGCEGYIGGLKGYKRALQKVYEGCIHAAPSNPGLAVPLF